MNTIDDDSWDVKISKDDKCVYIRTTDYHAEPLRLSLDRLRYMMGQLENKDTQTTAQPITKNVKPSDITFLEKRDGWDISISKRDKSLHCDNDNPSVEPLVLHRKDLYKFGKMMNRRAKRFSRGF